MDVHALIQYLSHQRHIVDYTYLAAAACLIYDHLLTLHLEIKLIWLAKWTYTTVIFLLIRYLAILDALLVIWSHLPRDVSLDACSGTIFPTYEYTATLLLLLAEVILSLRTWAVWRQNRMIGIGLGLMTIVHFVVQFYATHRYARSFVFFPSPYPGFRGCFLIRADTSLWVAIQLAASAAVEFTVLTLMVISAFRLYKRGGSGELVEVIHRDGILFYVYLFALKSFNLVFMYTTPADLMTAMIPLDISLYAVFTCRIVLNIRAVNHHSVNSDLHTTFHDLPRSTMQFSPGDDDSLEE